MAGYCGYSMSNNAVRAYDQGKKPLSKWTKGDLLDALEDKADYARKLTTSELRDELLEYREWHHTGKFYNATRFYGISYEKAEGLTKERVDEIIARRTHSKPDKQKPTFITALVTYTEWEGTRKHPKPVKRTEVVKFLSDAKIVACKGGNKRLSSLTIVYKIEQKTKYASEETLRRKYHE